jgi:Concanavalin A-like lectin/glucanases superfamily/Bacterial Ig domain
LLTLSAASTNTALVPIPNIDFGGSGTNRTVTVTPAAGISGTSRITVTVTDTNGSSASDSFLLTVLQSNSPPVLSEFIDRITAEDTPISGIGFTIGDGETSAGSLALAAVSSNTALLANAAIAFGGSGSNRTLTLTPALNQSGTTLVTITVSDGLVPVSQAFLLTVTPANDAPTISAIAGPTIPKNQATADLPFTVGDPDNAAATLTVSATSSNPALAPVANISFGGSGSNRTVRVTPATNQTGTATITVSVSDGSLSASNSFLLTVQEPAPPVAANLISWWKFDEVSGASAFDSASNNVGILLNSPARVPGRVGTGALQFNGVNQYVNVPDANSLDLTTNFSFTIWLKPSALINSTSGRRDVFKKFLSYWLLWNFPANDGRLSFVLNSGNPVVKSTTASWPAGQWQHIACTYDGVTMRIYVNGVLEGSQATTLAAINTANPLQIGGNTEQGFYFPGCVDDVRLYRAALNATDVLNLFNGTAPSFFPAATFGPPALSILVDVDREMVVLSWAAQPDATYRVEYNDTLGSDEWLPLAEGLRGVNGLATFEEGHLANRQRFYRVVIEP